jgi:outer membrane protein assembly factor BamB
VVLLEAAMAGAGDWPQWRGPHRGGQANGGTPLADAWPEKGPRKIWQSESVPSVEKGGLGSVAVAGGRVYLFASLNTDQALKTRTLSTEGIGLLGWPPADMPDHLVKGVEEARLSDQRAKLQPEELPPWVDHWVAMNVTEAEILPWADHCRRRLALGRATITDEILAKLRTIQDKPFAGPEELDKWLSDNDIAGLVRQAVLRVVPNRLKLATDTLYCFDAADGRTLWKQPFPGQPHPYGSSSTPCIAQGRCYFVGSGAKAYCLDAADGRLIWESPCAKGQVSSSFLVLGRRAYVQTPELKALDADTGKEIWTQGQVVSLNASPAYWTADGKTCLICHNEKDLACVDADDGRVRWRAAAGGNSTASVAGDVAVVMSENQQVGLAAYRLSAGGAEKLWNFPRMINAASPLIQDGYVYASANYDLACFELSSGKLLWQEKKAPSASISSPVLADGKIYTVGNLDGEWLAMIQASPDKYRLLAKAGATIARGSTPAIADGRIYLRLRNAVACYDLAATPATQPARTGGTVTSGPAGR